MNEQNKECQHRYIKQKFCCRCGIFYDQNLSIHGLKHLSLNRQGLNSHQIIQTLRENEFDLSKNKNYWVLNHEILNAFQEIIRICNQFQTNFHTKILAIYIFCHSLDDRQKFLQKDIYICILISLKNTQSSLLKINCQRIQQILISRIYSKGQLNQYELISEQMEKLQKINFKTKLVTFVDYLQFYVISGIMFNFEVKNKKSSDYNKLIFSIDNSIQKYVKNGLFLSQPNQQYLALKILYHGRQKCGNIDQIWNWQIEQITKTKKIMIKQLIQQKKALKNYDINRTQLFKRQMINQALQLKQKQLKFDHKFPDNQKSLDHLREAKNQKLY